MSLSNVRRQLTEDIDAVILNAKGEVKDYTTLVSWSIVSTLSTDKESAYFKLHLLFSSEDMPTYDPVKMYEAIALFWTQEYSDFQNWKKVYLKSEATTYFSASQVIKTNQRIAAYKREKSLKNKSEYFVSQQLGFIAWYIEKYAIQWNMDPKHIHKVQMLIDNMFYKYESDLVLWVFYRPNHLGLIQLLEKIWVDMKK